MPGVLRRAVVRVLRRRQLSAIEYAGELERKVTIEYVKKDGDIVERTISPYETKPHRTSGTLMVYATDTLHNNIHSFIASRIRKVSKPDGPFEPQWPVQYGVE